MIAATASLAKEAGRHRHNVSFGASSAPFDAPRQLRPQFRAIRAVLTEDQLRPYRSAPRRLTRCFDFLVCIQRPTAPSAASRGSSQLVWTRLRRRRRRHIAPQNSRGGLCRHDLSSGTRTAPSPPSPPPLSPKEQDNLAYLPRLPHSCRREACNFLRLLSGNIRPRLTLPAQSGRVVGDSNRGCKRQVRRDQAADGIRRRRYGSLGARTHPTFTALTGRCALPSVKKYQFFSVAHLTPAPSLTAGQPDPAASRSAVPDRASSEGAAQATAHRRECSRLGAPTTHRSAPHNRPCRGFFVRLLVPPSGHSSRTFDFDCEASPSLPRSPPLSLHFPAALERWERRPSTKPRAALRHRWTPRADGASSPCSKPARVSTQLCGLPPNAFTRDLGLSGPVCSA